ncbi:hypothetical protein QFZ62_000334 [Clavibacter sp. B3I6]|uniref:hypothetical protein n=1 Tax=Clavibacter sp. B3I6 TaxID=3042268 RepID=UPI0027899380|nr:hypothetical protein [Clavibacter sp. B3I6]MDQ0743026.1 hypothetical protein [Clavibacter sp. B3I6]
MHTVTRAVAATALALTSALSIGFIAASAAQAADRVHVHAVAAEPPTVLPAPTHLTGSADGVAPVPVEVTRRCTGATGRTASGGPGAPDHTVVDADEVTEDPSSGTRGAAGDTAAAERVHVGGAGTWSMLAGSPGAATSTDPSGRRGAEYHVVEPEDVGSLFASVRCARAVPLR